MLAHRALARALAALATAVATLLALLVTAAPAQARGRSLAERRAANAVLSTMNAERHAHGLPALVPNYDLIVSAWRHDLTMAAHNALSHQLPGEAAFGTRIRRAGYAWTRCAENIAWNSSMTTSGAVAVQRAMYAERPPGDGHRVNMLSRSYRDVGVAAYIDPRHHKIWLTVDFGHH